MKIGLVVVLGCLLVEASLGRGAEDGLKNLQKKDSKEEKMVEVMKKNSGGEQDLHDEKKITKKDSKEIQEGTSHSIDVKGDNNTSNCNVSTKVNSTNISSNVTNFNSSSDIRMNFTEFHKTNYSLENVERGTELTDTDEYFTESITTEYYDPKKFERRSDDLEDLIGEETSVEDVVKSIRKTSPKIDGKMVEIAFKGDQATKIKHLLEEYHNPKKFQRRTFDIMRMLGLKNKYDAVVKITKEVAVPVPYTVEKKIPVPVRVEVEHPVPIQVPKAFPVTVEKKVYYPVKEYIHAPYPVYKKVPYLVKIAVEKPVPVHIEKPYPVYIERKVPYPVEKQVHYPVKIPVDRPIPVKIPVVKNVYYPVEKKVVYPVAVPVEKPVAVPVEKPYPVYVEKKVPVPVETHVPYVIPEEETKLPEGTSTIEHQEFKDHSFVPSEEIKIDHQNNQFGKTEGGFVPIVENHDTTKLQDKKDEELTLEEPKTRENTTKKPSIKVESKKNGEVYEKKEKDYQEFGRKIKKT